MPRREPLWNKISAPSVLLVVTALFTGLFIAPSFDSARPRTAALAWDPVNVVGQADGLITFDPLEQAYGKLGNSRPWSEGSEDQRARFEIATLADGFAQASESSGRLLLLLESVRGGALSEDHERRLRGRYASSAALVREGLYPRQSKRLNLCWFAPEKDAKFADPDRGGVLVPYEFFDAAPGATASYEHVCVCWIDEAAIERDPLGFGLAFERALDKALANVSVERERVDLCWLGPTTSGRLKELVSGFTALGSAAGASRLKIATPYATSPKVKLPSESEPVAGVLESVDADWNKPGLSIRRAINTDSVLATLLVAELVARLPALLPMIDVRDSTRDTASPLWIRLAAIPLRVVKFIPPDLATRPVRVALIAEQDSTYGQSWLDNMEAARTASLPQHPQLERLQFTVFPVFGWVDALVRDSKDNAAATNVSRDYPAESHQLDYLGRLRDDIATAGRFDAICVFATDQYDTMMILEALRPQFPGAAFFTTDLDVRYLHARHAPFTRNLVVASHFGLSPAPDDADASMDAKATVRRAAPEFRDGYQTGVYLAVRDVARRLEPRPPATAGIYEIGRTRAVELNSAAQADSPEPLVRARADDRTQLENFASALISGLGGVEVLAAPRVAESPSAPGRATPARRPAAIYVWAGASVAGLLLALLVFAVRPRPVDSRRRRSDARIALMFFGLTVPALGLLLLLGVLTDAEARYVAEPLYLFEGLSAWPTFGLRAAGVVVCVAALVSIELRLRRFGAAIAAEQGIDSSARSVSAFWVADWSSLDAAREAFAASRGQGLRLRVQAAVRAVALELSGANQRGAREATDGAGVARDIDELWAFLCRSANRPAWTLARVALLAFVLYAAIAPFFILAPPPPSPVRGELAYLLDRLTLFASVFVFLMLTVRVMEVSFFASRAIGRVVDSKAITLRAHGGDVVAEGRERLELAKRIAAAVEPLAWGPMAALGLMIAARASVFDAWPWPSVLMSVFALFFVMLLLAIVGMRRQCESARASVIGTLDAQRERCADDQAASRRLAALRDEIESLTGGAFSPLVQHPLLRALAFPLAAFGANLAFERNLLERLLGSL